MIFAARRRWTVSVFLYLGLGAAVLQMRGALLPIFQQEFNISESLLGLLAPAGTLGFTSVALLMGLAAGRIEIRKYIQIGAALTAVMTLLIGASGSYYFLLVAITARGMSNGLPGGLTRPILGHLYPENRGRIFNIHEAVWALGAACGPLIVNFVLSFSNWRSGYFLLGVLSHQFWFLCLPRKNCRWKLKNNP